MSVESNESAAEEPVVLTDQQRKALRRVLGQVPVIGLPVGGVGWGLNPQTDQQVVEIIEHLGAALGESLRTNESLREKLNAHDRDLAAFRRVIGTRE